MELGFKTLLIVHGTKGHPDRNWFPWLKSRAEKRGYNVLIPSFPTPENQSLGTWWKVLETILPQFAKKEVVLVGHSLGATFLLHMLEKHPVRRAIFVSPVMGNINIPEYDALNETFTDYSFDWGKITRNAHDKDIFHGDNDPYVPLTHAQGLHQHIRGNLHVIPNGGHLNQEAGYVEFPKILDVL